MGDQGSRGLGVAGTFAVALVALLLPATAAAAPARPGVTTGGVANLAQTSVVLKGRVDPNELETTYFFQYGTTTLYGAQTPAASAGAGANPRSIAAAVAGLLPATRYHYRLV